MFTLLRSPRLRRGAVGLLTAATAVGFMAAPAHAVEAPVSAAVTGNFTSPAATIDLAGGAFVGTYDSDTGALVGGFTFPPAVVPITTPIVGDVIVQISQEVDGTGTVDPLAGTATYSGELILSILEVNSPALSGTVTDCRYSIPVDATGTVDETGVVSLSADPISVSVKAGDAHTCTWSATSGSISGAADPVIVNDTSSMDASFDVGDTSAEPPPPPPPPPPAGYGGCNVTVSDTTPAAGQAITVSGTGATPSTAVSATIGSAAAGSGTSDATGGFSFSATVPSSASGAATLSVDCGATVASVSLTVGGTTALPRTGASDTGVLTGAALGALGLGALALVAARKRRSALL